MIKKIDTSYVDEITTLFMDVFTNEPWNDEWKCSEDAKAYVLDLVANKNSLAYAYFADGVLSGLCMGYVFHWYSGKELYVKEFCIARALQAKGHGKIFLAEIENALREEGLRALWLMTDRNTPAYKFYLGNGFHELAEYVFLAKGL